MLNVEDTIAEMKYVRRYDSAEGFCYMNAEGVMIFELGSVRNRWGVYKKAIWKAMRKMGEYDD